MAKRRAIKTETTALGRSVGQPHRDMKKAREIKVQLSTTPGTKGAKGHKRRMVRPVHQGGTYSYRHLVPKPAGVSDKTRQSVFGDL